jgi:hypothetical protein
MGRFDRQVALAQRLIEENGELCQCVIAGAPTSGPDTPWIQTEGVPDTHDVSVLFTINSGNPFFQLLSGSPVEEGSQKALMASVGFTPKADDTIVRGDGTKMALKSATKLAPNGQIILWKLVFKS